MEDLPYIDAHGVEVAVGAAAAWQAVVQVAHQTLGGAGEDWLGRVLAVEPAHGRGRWDVDVPEGAALAGFAVDHVRPGELLSLRGRHRFSRYRLTFEVVAAGPDRSYVWARTWADFPGLAGAVYRTLVIGSGGHAVLVRRMLRRTAATAAAGRARTAPVPAGA